MSSLQDAPLVIAATEIVGAVHTRADTIETHLQSAYEAGTFGEIVAELLEARQRLNALDIFESVDVRSRHAHVTEADIKRRTVHVESPWPRADCAARQREGETPDDGQAGDVY